MANVFIQDSTMSAIGDAIRAKTGGTDLILPADMATAISGITTGSGDSGGENGLITPVRFHGLPSYTKSNPITGTVYITIPEDATVGWANLYSQVYNGTTTVGTIVFTPTGYTATEADFSASYPQYKKVSFTEYSVTNPSAVYCSSRDIGGSVAIVKIPNAYIKDNILYAEADCKGILPATPSLLSTTGQRDGFYFEGLDLRGSQVRCLPDYFGQGHKELKKIWLSEVFDKLTSSTFGYCGEWLEELHFTATTPVPVSSSYVFNGLNASCKIYVPAGTLSAYTSAQYYPSASTYTYIEE